MTDSISTARRSQNMRQIRAKDTAPELVVRRMVHRMGFRYRLHVAKLPGKPDLVFARMAKIIEVRGCFWHQHKGCIDSHIPKSRIEYWGPKLRSNEERDQQNLKLLRALGNRVLIVWECETRRKERLELKLTRFLNKE